MVLNNIQYNKALTVIGFFVVILTAILEFLSPRGVFITWGYFLGVLLTIPNNSKRNTINASLLSGFFISLSLFYLYGEAGSTILVLNRLYAFGGLIIVTLIAVRTIFSDKTAEEEKTLMAGIFSHGTEGIILTNGKFEIVLLNPFAENLFGRSVNKLEGLVIENLIPGFKDFSVETEKDKHQGTTNDNRLDRKELFAKHKNGNLVPIEITFNKFKSDKEDYSVIFVTDITLRKQNEDILRDKKRELEIVNQELEAFTYSVSHDLRAPLRGVGGYAQMLNEDYCDILNPEGKRLLMNIQYSAEKMGNLIDDLLTFSRLGKKRINKTNVDLEAMANKIINELSEVTLHHAKIIVHPLHLVQADFSLFNQVMTNLLSNALKYSSKKEEPVIEIASEYKEDQIIISVKDNGAGFDPSYAHKLFGVFQRLHTETEFAGTGVGLAIAQRIVHKHNGKIWAEGREGEGATFYVSLPCEESEIFEHISTYNTSYK